jgi:mono/diheme cytochrome c family protein
MQSIRLAAAFALSMFVSCAGAQTPPAPFKAGNSDAGRALAEKDCVSCHAARFPGDPDKMYTRADHRVKTPGQLLARVQACNANLGKGYFPDEEEHIAAYLNLEFYKFKP